MAEKQRQMNFGAALLDAKGEQIREKFGPPEMVQALVKYGIPRGQIDSALMMLQRFVGAEPPNAAPLTAASVVMDVLQTADAGMTRGERADRMRIVFKALDPKQPVVITDTEKEIILKAIEKQYGGLDASLVCFRIEELLTQGAQASASAPDAPLLEAVK